MKNVIIATMIALLCITALVVVGSAKIDVKQSITASEQDRTSGRSRGIVVGKSYTVRAPVRGYQRVRVPAGFHIDWHATDPEVEERAKNGTGGYLVKINGKNSGRVYVFGSCVKDLHRIFFQSREGWPVEIGYTLSDLEEKSCK